MKQKKNIILRFPIICSIVFPVLMLLLASIAGMLLAGLFPAGVAGLFENQKFDLESTLFSFCEIIICALWVLGFHKIGRKEWVFGFHSKKLWKGVFVFGWPMLLFGLENISDSLIFLGGHFVGNTFGVFIALLCAFGAGFGEEVVFRGIILNNFLYQWRDKKRAVLLAAVFSAVFFGVLHLTNIGNVPIADTLTQVLYAGGAGIGFAALYLRTGNLWVGVIVHTFADFLNFIFIKEVEEIAFTRIEELVTAVIAIIFGFYIIRAAKEEDIKKNFAWIFEKSDKE